jgi:hypothetical protein
MSLMNKEKMERMLKEVARITVVGRNSQRAVNREIKTVTYFENKIIY